MPASNSPIPYTGNKSCIIDTILAVMPERSIYIEPCIGSAEIFLRKKPVKTEIINDYNGDLVNFFRVLQSNEKLAFLLGRLYLSANSELIISHRFLVVGVKDLLNSAKNLWDASRMQRRKNMEAPKRREQLSRVTVSSHKCVHLPTLYSTRTIKIDILLKYRTQQGG